MLSWLCWTEERKASPTENEWAMSSLFWQSKAAFLTTSVWSRMEVLGSQAGNHREHSIQPMYQCINVSQPLSDINKVVVWTHGRALDDHLMISLRPIFAIMRPRHHNGKNRPEGDHNWSSRALYPLCPDSHFVNAIIRRGHQRVICWRASDEGIITEASGGEGRASPLGHTGGWYDGR